MKKLINYQVLKLTIVPVIAAAGMVALCQAEEPVNGTEAENSEEIMDRLYMAESEQDLLSALQESEKAGLFEAKVIFIARNRQVAFADEIQQQWQQVLQSWDADTSKIASSKDEFEGIIKYSLALIAKDAGNVADFETHIKDAIWLAPEYGEAFTSLIVDHKRELRLANLRVPMDIKLTTSGEEETTLQTVLGKNRAMLVDF